jgi:hypothetical protein
MHSAAQYSVCYYTRFFICKSMPMQQQQQQHRQAALLHDNPMTGSLSSFNPQQWTATHAAAS